MFSTINVHQSLFTTNWNVPSCFITVASTLYVRQSISICPIDYHIRWWKLSTWQWYKDGPAAGGIGWLPSGEYMDLRPMNISSHDFYRVERQCHYLHDAAMITFLQYKLRAWQWFKDGPAIPLSNSWISGPWIFQAIIFTGSNMSLKLFTNMVIVNVYISIIAIIAVAILLDHGLGAITFYFPLSIHVSSLYYFHFLIYFTFYLVSHHPLLSHSNLCSPSIRFDLSSSHNRSSK